MKTALKLSLIGLLAWHGFAGGISNSAFLSGLQKYGLFGFHPGTVSKKDVGESSFLDAVEREDVRLLLKRLHDRLNGPFTKFMEDLHAVDHRGWNVFHALAAAQANQERFAAVMEDLIRISRFHIEPHRQDVKVIETANVIIFPAKDLGSKPLIRAIIAEKSHAAALREIENFVTKHTAATVISYLHSKNSSEPVFDSPYWNALPSVYQQTFLELLFTRNPRSKYRPLEDVKIHRPYLMKDFQGLRP